MYLISLFIPFFSFIYICFFGRFLGNFGSFCFLILNMFLLLILSILFFYEISISGSVCLIKTFEWLFMNYFYISIGFIFDNLSICLFFLVAFVSFFVHFYSFTYMISDPYVGRFVSLLSFFTFAMLVLVFSDNLLQFFLGWELVGVSSYLLISFWYTRMQANKSALKAIFINRIGDFFLMLALFFCFFVLYNFDFLYLSAFILEVKPNILFFICFFFFLASIAKSSQVGLHVWLPDAMEGPTPVSALIHAATMVTAGVFLLLRLSFVLNFTYQVFFLILVLFGSFTSLMSSIIALFQNDIKKVIAYSTCSQLGYMFFALGLSLSSLSLFHLFNHGFFKALLFLGAGSIIHSFNDEQDIRKMGGVAVLTPFSLVLFFFASLSLMGFPFLTGFFSKDLILISFFFSFEYFFDFSLFFFFCLLAAFFTSYYSVRVLFFVFFKNYESSLDLIFNYKEDVNIFYFLPFVSLFCGCLFFGYLFHDFFIGYGIDVWTLNFPLILYYNTFFDFLDFETLEFIFLFKCLPLFFSLIGSLFFFILFYIFTFFFRFSFFVHSLYYVSRLFNLFIFFQKKFLFDLLYFNIYMYFLKKSFQFFYFIDRGILEISASFFVTLFFKKIFKMFNIVSTGIIFHYFFILFYNLIFLLLSYLFFNYVFTFFFFLLVVFFINNKKQLDVASDLNKK